MRLTLLAATLLVLSGCASPYIRLDAVGPSGEAGRSARYSIGNQEEGTLATVTISAAGARRERIEQRDADTVRFALSVDTPGGEPVELPTESFRARDDMGNVYRPLRTNLPPEPAPGASPPAKPPVTELIFDTGAADRLAQTGSVTLEWGYRFRGREVRHETRFLPVRVAYRAVYYDPWYADPYYYGPYPYVNFGFWYHGH